MAEMRCEADQARLYWNCDAQICRDLDETCRICPDFPEIVSGRDTARRISQVSGGGLDGQQQKRGVEQPPSGGVDESSLDVCSRTFSVDFPADGRLLCDWSVCCGREASRELWVTVEA